MPAHFQIPLDIPDVEIMAVRNGEKGEFILEVKSTLDYTHCRRCQRNITVIHGHDRPIRLQHLPILERKVYIELRPKRYRCPHCEGRVSRPRPNNLTGTRAIVHTPKHWISGC